MRAASACCRAEEGFPRRVASKTTVLDERFDAAYPALMLRSARSMRNQLTHGYSVVDLGVLWRTVHAFVPGMVSAARSIVSGAGKAVQPKD